MIHYDNPFTQSDDIHSLVTPAAFQAAMRGDLANTVVASNPGGIERQEINESRRARVEPTDSWVTLA